VTKIEQNPESPFAKIISTPVAEVTNHLQLLLLDLPDAKEAEIKPISEASETMNSEVKKENLKLNKPITKPNTKPKVNVNAPQ
jgi:hypothetical protein